MKFKLLLIFGLLSQIALYAQTKKAKNWYEFYRVMYDRISMGQKGKEVEDAIPNLDKNMSDAYKLSLERWDYSTMKDASTGESILDHKFANRIKLPISVKNGVYFSSAGILHTYGYIFSQLQTPYGLKGKRWIESRLDERLGLPAESFSPFAKKGEFLLNVTNALHSLIANTNKAVKQVGYLQETIVWKTKKKNFKANIYTYIYDLLPHPDYPDLKEKLLIYKSTSEKGQRFITAFPIDLNTVESIKQIKAENSNRFSPKYNWYIDPEWEVISYSTKGFKLNKN